MQFLVRHPRTIRLMAVGVGAIVLVVLAFTGAIRLGALEGTDHSVAEHGEVGAEADGVPSRDTVVIESDTERVLLSESDLTLVTSESNAGTCLHVESPLGMSGGCGFDASDAALSWMSGTETLAGVSVNFVAGVSPPNASLVEVGLGDETVSAPVVDGAWLVTFNNQAIADRGPSTIEWLATNGDTVSSWVNDVAGDS